MSLDRRFCCFSRPRDFPYVSYLCRRRQSGAVLSLPVQAQRQDTIERGAFGRWMIKHIDRCLAFARQRGLGVEQMEDIILVTGFHRTRSWANAVFLESQEDEQVSFEVRVTDVNGPNPGINWRFTPDQGAMLNWGPEGKHLVAAAGPSSDPDEYDHEPESDLGLTSLPTITKYRDPLHVLLEHVAERVPDCEMVVVHDDDLARIHGISDNHESLQSDALVHLLQKSKPDIIQVPSDWPNAEEYTSKNDTEPATIAMFSREFQEWGESHISLKGQSELRRSPSLEFDPFDIPIMADSQSRHAEARVSRIFSR
ncbi:hypothetical protein BC827DRAFT_574579 [Russula dissimulans]|nr:hypothetical protein BC827DRAFT_574579 [Russula dissimulans]